jgi:hypothetical protein
MNPRDIVHHACARSRLKRGIQLTFKNEKRVQDAQEISQKKSSARMRAANERPEQKTEIASEEKIDSPIKSARKRSKGWRAIEKLCVDSVSLISPAYLFMCFPRATGRAAIGSAKLRMPFISRGTSQN